MTPSIDPMSALAGTGLLGATVTSLVVITKMVVLPILTSIATVVSELKVITVKLEGMVNRLRPEAQE